MKTEVTNVYAYVAVNGERFPTEKECRDYEKTLPRHLVWCLSNHVTAKDLADDTVRVYELWYSYSTSEERYESPDFLREGGYYTHTEDHKRHIAFMRGTFTDVISAAVEMDSFYNHSQCYISPLVIKDV